VTTRLLDGTTGVERFKAMLGQRYYFKPQRVAIPGETTRQDDFSNIVAAFNGLIARRPMPTSPGNSTTATTSANVSRPGAVPARVRQGAIGQLPLHA
jgi:hypothetical protein